MRAFQRMRMACDAVGLVDKETEGSPKLDELERLLDEICVEGGHKVVVFSEWERMQAMAAEVCKRSASATSGCTAACPPSARGRLIDRFREDPACKVFLSTDAGGVGLNLQVASHVVNLDLPWNPAVLAQRIARVHRLGQREAVNVVLLVSEGSFEERMEGTLDAKRALFAAAVGDDQETKEVERSTLAWRIATLLCGEFAASTGAKPAAAPPDPVAALRARMGPALVEVARLADGRLVALVRGEVPADAIDGVVLLPASAAAALGRLGAASPLASAEVLYRVPEATPTANPGAEAARTLAALAVRKRLAAAALVAAGQAAEALPLFRDAMALACRSLESPW